MRLDSAAGMFSVNEVRLDLGSVNEARLGLGSVREVRLDLLCVIHSFSRPLIARMARLGHSIMKSVASVHKLLSFLS